MGQMILASASPRRKELLEQIGLEFEICPAKGEEVITSTVPEEVVKELSSQKAREVAAMLKQYQNMHGEWMTPQDMMVIGADTVVSAEGRILGKPKDEEDAFGMLSLLSGRTHQVYTGVTLVLLDASGRVGEHTFAECTEVTMKQLSEEEIRRYIATGEPMDKAGAYGIQGKCAIFVDKINGDYNNVVGLPVAALYRECRKLGIDLNLW
ncbi:MAG: Maf family protein [Roseburia sp.]